MAKQIPKDYSSETLGPHEETVVIRRPEIKQTRGLVDSLRGNWQALSDSISQRTDELGKWLDGFRKVEKIAPKTTQAIQDETTKILQPTADVVRARKAVAFPSAEEVKTLEEVARKNHAIRDIAEATTLIEPEESNGMSIETFTDSAGYRFKENPSERENQDYVATTEYGSVVADGMGGGASGKKAAEIVGQSFMQGLKTVKTADETKFKNAMTVSGKQAKEKLEALAGKEMTGAAVLVSKVLDTLPDGSKKIGVAWSGDVWGGVIKEDGTVDNERQTKDHSLLTAVEEVRQEKDPGKRTVLIEKLAKNMAQSDTSPIPIEEKLKQIKPAVTSWANTGDDAFQKMVSGLRKQMFYSINNLQEDLRIDTKVFDVAPGESFIQLTDGYTDVLKVPEDIEKAVKIANQTGRPVMQVLTELYLEVIGKGGSKEDNIGGTFMTVIPEISSNELEETEEDEWAEKTNPDFRIPSEDDFKDEHTQYGIKLPGAK